MTFTIKNPQAGQYYYSIAYTGGAIGGVASNGVTGFQSSSGNPLAGTNTKLAPAIGETIYGVMDGGAGSVNGITFIAPTTMGAGRYSDTLTIAACYDAACSQQVPGSPQTVDVAYVVTGDTTPITNVTVPLFLKAEASSSQTTAMTTSFQVSAINLPPRGAYVFIDSNTSAAITGITFESSASRTDQAADGVVTVKLAAPSEIGPGIYNDTLEVKVCFDANCSTPAHGSPWTVQLTYVVDGSAGTDYQVTTLPIVTGGIVWSDVTKKIYALIPGDSPLYPDTIAQIDPFLGEIETAVSLITTPGTLSMSRDRQYLYAAAPGIVYRLRVSDLGVESTISLAANQYVTAIKEAPDSPNTIAIELPTPTTTVTVFDNGAARPQSIVSTDAEFLGAFSWGNDSNSIFAGLSTSTGHFVERVTASNGGLSAVQTAPADTSLGVLLFSGDLQFSAGTLYWDGGAAFDTNTMKLVAPFTFAPNSDNVPRSYRLALDAPRDRAYFLTNEQSATAGPSVVTIEGVELSTRKELWVARFPSQNISGQLIRWGDDGLAFVTSGGSESLVLMSGPLVEK
ncbi:hypothetical protein [Hydrocarboniphaga sp.]|uniref:hypothetical protein n=1 Tax=Hydrocarboniphaga sp. TaxID=2033016 RepID=UPI0026210651|nr:hypothetical protein [Hydrocarboniphaga sp.]